MKTLQQLEQEYIEKAKALKLELELTEELTQHGLQPSSFCGSTWKAPYISYRKKDSYPCETYSLREGLALVEKLRPFLVPYEIRKKTHVTIQPVELLGEYKDGELKHSGEILLGINGGDGYKTTQLTLWIKLSKFFHVDIDILRPIKVYAYRQYTEDWEGHRRIKGPLVSSDIDGAYKLQYGTSCNDLGHHIVYSFRTVDNLVSVLSELEGKS